MPHHQTGGSGGGGHQEMALTQTRRGAVIQHHAVFAQHQPVSHPAHRQGREGVGIDEVQEAGRIRALNVDLAQGRDIRHPDRGPHHRHLAVAGLAPGGFTGAREIAGPVPEPGLDHRRAPVAAGLIRGQEALRRKARRPPSGPHRGDGHRAERRAEGGGAGFGNAPPRGIRQHRQRADVGVLALVGGHALRRVALHVLDRAEVLLRRLGHVLDRHVIGKVQPGTALAGHRPDGLNLVAAILGLGDRHIGRTHPDLAQRPARGCDAIGQTGGGREHAHCRPRRDPPRHRVGRWHEGGNPGRPERAAVQMTGQVQCRVPAARDPQKVGLDPGLGPLVADGDLRQRQTALRIDHLSPGKDRKLFPLRGIRARVDDPGHADAGGMQITRHLPRGIGIGKQRHALPCRHAIAVQIGADRAAQHDAGPVVVAKRDGPLQRARRQHRAPRHDPPEAFARQVRLRGQMQPHAFQRAEGAVIIGPGHGGACHEPDIGERTEFRQHVRCPVGRRLAGDLRAIRQQAAPHAGVLLGQDHIRPGPCRRQRRHQPGGAGADDQQVAFRPGLFIDRLVTAARQAAKTGGAADHRLVEPFPEGARPHEGLVIEAGTQKGGGQIVHRQQIMAQRRPAVLALRAQPFIDFLHRGADVRGLLIALQNLDQRIRLFRPGGQHAARAVVLEAASDQLHPVRQQRRRQRIARMPGKGPPVEAKADGSAAVDQTLARNPHVAAPRFGADFGGVRSATSATSRISCVTVLRVTRSQLAQPVS